MAKVPILWDMSYDEVCGELTRLEYRYGMKDENGEHPYPMADNKDRDIALIASALKHIMMALRDQR